MGSFGSRLIIDPPALGPKDAELARRTLAPSFLKFFFFDLYSKRHMTSRFLVDTTGAVGTTDPALSSKVKQAYSFSPRAGYGMKPTSRPRPSPNS